MLLPVDHVASTETVRARATRRCGSSFLDRHLVLGDVRGVYARWPRPSLILSDGAYGVGGFPGDPRTPDVLPEWYAEHVEAWSRFATPATTLFLWNTEIGWALLHPLLIQHGWEYVQIITWNKGTAHIAGNVNGDTIRHFPVVTEVCAFYRRRLVFSSPDGRVRPAKDWLRAEWLRAGLPLNRANEACGVRNAATRKYLTQDWLWYFPPPAAMEMLATYANCHGDPRGRPYFSLDGRSPLTASAWASLRSPWNHIHALTNVWSLPPIHGGERLRGTGQRLAPRVHRPSSRSALHLNQKPLMFMRQLLIAATRPGDVIWEPFGGLCTATVAAWQLGRVGYAAETVPAFYEAAKRRLERTIHQRALAGLNATGPRWGALR